MPILRPWQLVISAAVLVFTVWVLDSRTTDYGPAAEQSEGPPPASGDDPSASPDTPAPHRLTQEEMNEGARNVRAMDAKDIAEALDGTPSEKAAAESAHNNLTGTLKLVERYQWAVGAVDAQSQTAVACGIRTQQWRVSLIGQIDRQFRLDQAFARAWQSLSPAEILAARGWRAVSRNLQLSPDWKTSCRDLQTIPYMQMYDLVAAGVEPYPTPTETPKAD